jgi:hypothetical protein
MGGQRYCILLYFLKVCNSFFSCFVVVFLWSVWGRGRGLRKVVFMGRGGGSAERSFL